MDNNDKRIEEIISLAGKIKRAEANPYLFTRIRNSLKNNGSKKAYLPLPKAALGFLSIFILVLFNLFVIVSSGSSEKNNDNNFINSNNTSETLVPSQTNQYHEILNTQ
jgi:hypothetical protein